MPIYMTYDGIESADRFDFTSEHQDSAIALLLPAVQAARDVGDTGDQVQLADFNTSTGATVDDGPMHLDGSDCLVFF